MIINSAKPGCMKKIEEGEAHRKRSDFKQALSCFDDAISIDPECPEAWNYKGLTLLVWAQGLNPPGLQIAGSLQREAVECFTSALALDPNYPEAWYHKANALEAVLDFQGALDCYDKAIEIDPKHARTSWFMGGATVWYNKGTLLATRLRKYDQALACYERALEIDPDYPEAWKNCGVAHLLVRDFSRAVYCFEQALTRAGPQAPWSWVQHTLKQKQEAIEALGRFAEAEKQEKYWMSSRKMPEPKTKRIFISHRCLEFDHSIVYALQHELQLDGHTVLVDPFIGGDRTCDKAQRAIRDATHFVLIATENSINCEHEERGYQPVTESWWHARWVTIERTYAELCAMNDCLVVICIKVGKKTPIPKPLQQFIHIDMEDTSGLGDVCRELRNCVSSTTPSKDISIDTQLSQEHLNRGREAERKHALCDTNYSDDSELHHAIALYDQAILYNFCNHHAWLNKGWCLWKLESDMVAWKYVNTAQLLSPHSDRLGQIVDRMLAGQRTLR